MLLKKSEMSWIVVSDLNKALDYYTKVLGLKLLVHNAEFGWAELSGAEAVGAMLGIAEVSTHDPDSKPGQNAVMTFTVDNLEKAKAELAKKGAKFKGDVLEVPGMVKLQTFVDLDNNTFQLVESLEKK